MKPPRFPILSALSLLVCLSTIALWIRSYRTCDILIYDADSIILHHRTQWALASRTGDIDIGRCDYGLKSGNEDVNLLFFTTNYPGAHWRHIRLARPEDPIRLDSWNRLPADSFWKRLGFDNEEAVDIPMFDMGAQISGDLSGRILTFPHWLLVLATAILPALTLIKFLRARRRRSLNLCPHCRYNLCAHAAGEKCPECGTAISRKAPS